MNKIAGEEKSCKTCLFYERRTEFDKTTNKIKKKDFCRYMAGSGQVGFLEKTIPCKKYINKQDCIKHNKRMEKYAVYVILILLGIFFILIGLVVYISRLGGIR